MFGLTPYENSNNLFKSLNDFENNSFSEFSRNFFRTDVIDKGSHYLLSTDLPGFDKEDINVSVENGYLKITAKNEKKSEGNSYVYRERSSGTFVRAFTLNNVDEDNITAEYKNGVLTVNLPKTGDERSKSKKITVS